MSERESSFVDAEPGPEPMKLRRRVTYEIRSTSGGSAAVTVDGLAPDAPAAGAAKLSTVAAVWDSLAKLLTNGAPWEWAAPEPDDEDDTPTT